LSPAPPVSVLVSSSSPVPIIDDGVTYSSLTVTNVSLIQSVEVGVRLDHPRVSDLALTLISPSGTRVLLDQNRGGASADLGVGLISTQSELVVWNPGDPMQAATNVIDTGLTSGTINIVYSFYNLPDTMRIYYESDLIYDSGPVAFGGSTNISYGPGTSSVLTIIMDEFETL